MTMLISRAASLLIAVSIGIATILANWGDPRALMVCVYFLFPLALIWFPEEMGSYIGPVPHGRVTHESPPVFIAIAGWLFLVGLPAIVFFLSP